MVTSKVKWALLALVSTIVLSAGIALGAPPIIAPDNRKFDHAAHEASAKASGQGNRAVATCNDCHKMKPDGTRSKNLEHAERCIKCHDNPKTCPQVQAFGGTPKNPARRCDVCHLPTGNCKLPPMPQKPVGHTYQAKFAHAEHIGFKVAIEADCAKCHPQNAPANAPTAGGGHASCFRCHATGPNPVSRKLPGTNCEGCHQPPKAKAGPSSDPFRLAKFDHRKHHNDAKTASCTGCHDSKKMATNDAYAVPRPSMSTCQASCHNGQPGRAFSAVGTKCTTCHKSAGGLVVQLPKDQVFSHTKHVARNVKIEGACTNCHGIKDDGKATVEAPTHNKDHMPCAASGCHLNEFMSRTVKICYVCHDKANPWEKAIARMNTGTKHEFFGAMNHQAHLQKKGATNAACTDCHGDKLAGAKKQKGHEACSECHGRGAPAHAMTDCAKCHSTTSPTKGGVSEWSVAATFGHEKHSKDPRVPGKATNCVECHQDVAKSTSLSSVTKPKMQSCDGCHNGKTSFKSTGFECSKCHTPAKQPSTPTVLQGSTAGGSQALLDAPRNRGPLR